MTNKRTFQYLATFTGCFSVITSGINLGWTSPYLPQLLKAESEIPMTDDEGSWCAVMPLVGAPLGALLCAIFVDKVGRKNTVLAMAPITTIAWIVIAYAESVFVLCSARFIIGSVEGGLYTVLPMYLGEISDPEIRGLLTSTIAIASIIGTLFINIIGPIFPIYTSSFICGSIPIIHFITFIWMPESPYYLIKKEKFEESKTSLKILRANENVEEEFSFLCAAVKRQETSEKARLSDLFIVNSNRRAVIIFVILCMTNKFSGKNPLVFYTATIFDVAEGFLDTKTSVIIYSSVELLATTIAIILVDKCGRRPLMITSALGCALSLASEGLYFYIQDNYSEFIEHIRWLPLVALVTYNIIFSVGLAFGPVLILGELFPTNIKAKALGLADTFSITVSTIASKVFQILKDGHSMYLPFWVFSGCSAIGLIFIILYVPETKGKTLEEIQLDMINLDKKGKEQK